MKKFSFKALSVLLAILTFMSAFAVMPFTASAEDTQTVADTDFKGMTFSTDKSAPMWKMPYTLTELPYTIETWFTMPTTVTSGRGGTIFSSYLGSGNNTLCYEINSNGIPRIYIRNIDGNTVDKKFSKIDVRTGEQIHLVLVNDPTTNTFTCYVNGVAAQSISCGDTPTEYDTANIVKNVFSLGGDNRSINQYPFKGYMKTFAAYTEVKTAADIAANYANGVNAADSSLLAYYNLTSQPTDYIPDLSGNGNYMTPNGVDYTPDVPVDNSGMTFPLAGNNDIWRMRKPLAEAPYTVSTWIKVSQSVGSGRVGGIISNYDGGSATGGTYYGNATYGNRAFIVEIHENGNPRVYYGTDPNGSGSLSRDSLVFDKVDVRTGEWMQLTFVKEEAAVVCYVNGVEVQRKATRAPYHSDILLQPFAFGGDNRAKNQYPFKGSIKDFALYNTPLTAEQVALSYTEGVDNADESLILHYDVVEAPEGDYIADLSGNGYYSAKSSYVSEIESENNIVLGEMGTGSLGNGASGSTDADFEGVEFPYSFAVVGDTQYMTKYDGAYNRGHLKYVYDWLIANAEKKNIQYVFGLGDITDTYNKTSGDFLTANEWAVAYEQISRLNGIIPYSIVRGNHDNEKYMNQYFANEAYMGQFVDPDIDDQSKCFYEAGSVLNAYTKFTVGSTKYLLIVLDDNANDDILAWAGNVVSSNPDYRVIVTTHTYLGYTGTHIDDSDTYSYAVGNVKDGENNGQQIWEKFTSQYRNIFLVLCGHDYKSTDILKIQRKGVHGNTVTEMLICPQSLDSNSDKEVKSGMVAMLYFSEDGKKVKVEYISTIQTALSETGEDQYKSGNQFKFVLISDKDVTAVSHKYLYTEDGYDFVRVYLSNGIYEDKKVPMGSADVHVYADGNDIYCDECGACRVATEGALNTKITWTYADGVLTVVGKGKIKNFSAGKAPWAALVDYVDTVVIGEGITYVGASAFYGFTKLDTVNLPTTLTAIGNYAFYGCSSLKNITIPANVTEIGAYAFRRTALTTANFAIGYGWSAGDNAFTLDEIVTGGATYLATGFYKTVWTRDVNAEAETMDPNFVDGGVCGNNIKWTVTKLENGKLKLTVSGEGAMPTFSTGYTPWFGYAADIVEVEVTEGVTTIGRCAFYGLKFVRKATIADTVTAIDDYGFYMCFLLKSIELPEGVTIGKDAFTKTGIAA